MARRTTTSPLEQRRKLLAEADAIRAKAEVLEVQLRARVGDLAARVGALELDDDVLAGALMMALDAQREGGDRLEEMRRLGARFCPRPRRRGGRSAGVARGQESAGEAPAGGAVTDPVQV
jgi:hypothetical protein